MSCLSPILVGDGLKAMVRCGRCMPCRLRRKQAWVGRLLLERLDHVAARFLTLTYASPEAQRAELDYGDLQKFLKRYRYYYGECRFYAVGEYGDKSGNAHWHVIVFGHQQEVVGHLLDFKPWPLGFAYDGSFTVHSAGYVAKYATKSMPRGRRNIAQMSRQPGIGLGRIAKIAEMAAAQLRGKRLDSWPGRFSFAGKSYPLYEGSMVAFQNAFLEAGGFAPLSLNPEDRHIVAMEAFADFGSRLQGERDAANSHWENVGVHGLKVTRERV